MATDAAQALEDLEGFEEGELDLDDDVGAEDEAEGTQGDDPFDILYKYHPELVVDYAETIAPRIPLQVAMPSQEGIETSQPQTNGVDPNHMSPPFLTKYEYTTILGSRANQLAQGARPFVAVPEYVTEPVEIARLELEQRQLPFIVKRPMPDGTFEYWRLSDLMIL